MLNIYHKLIPILGIPSQPQITGELYGTEIDTPSQRGRHTFVYGSRSLRRVNVCVPVDRLQDWRSSPQTPSVPLRLQVRTINWTVFFILCTWKLPTSSKFLSAGPKKTAGADEELTACLAFCKEFAIQWKMGSTSTLAWWGSGAPPQ